MADLATAVAALDDGLHAAEGLVDRAVHRDLRHDLAAVRGRLRHLGDTVVVALVGGTGSGKSSILNALAGEQVVTAGVLRPTTDRPVAWAPRDAEPSLRRLLEDFGVEDVVTHDRGRELAVLDLPDLDSVERAHRATVDALLPRVDLAVWVLDPQKYNDRVIHELIAARARWAPSLVFVLNQVDRLPAGALGEVLADLRGSLHADGLGDVEVLATAAAPADGPPQGIDDLRALLAERVADKQVVLRKLRTDVADLAARLAEAAEVGPAGSDGVVERWPAVRDRVAELAAASVVDGVAEQALARSGARVAAAVGSGPLGRVWHGVRRSPVLRALGAPQDRPAPAPPGAGTAADGPGDGPGRPPAGASAALTGGVVDLSTGAGGSVGRAVRRRLPPDDLDRDLRSSLVAADRAVPEATVHPRGWWRLVAVVQTLVTLAVVVGAVWWWSDPAAVRPGDVPWPPLVVVGGAVLLWVLSRWVRASGHRHGRAAALARRDRVADEVAARLDDRVGGVLGELTRDRDRVREAVAVASEVGGA